MKPLFHKQLYLNEEEYEFYAVQVPDDFFESKHIANKYKLLFQDKLEQLIQRYLYDFVDENYEIIELAENFIINFKKKGYLKVDGFMDKMSQEITKSLSELFEQYSGLSEKEISYFIDYPIPVIAENLCQFRNISYLLNDFCERLEILQKGENIIDYYLENNLTEENDIGFLENNFFDTNSDLLSILSYAFEYSPL